jgi:hypothetical protein
MIHKETAAVTTIARASCGLAVAFLLATGRGSEKHDPEKPTARSIRQLEGWTVRVDDRLLRAPNEVLGTRSLKLLEAKLGDITYLAASWPGVEPKAA